MVYVDTSVLVALHTRESSSTSIEDWLASTGEVEISTATWSLVEFAGALGLKQRTRQLTARGAEAAWSTFSTHCDADLRLLDVDREAFEDAARDLRSDRAGLRAGDALHLAVARRNGIRSLASLDGVMARAARAMGMEMVGFRA